MAGTPGYFQLGMTDEFRTKLINHAAEFDVDDDDLENFKEAVNTATMPCEVLTWLTEQRDADFSDTLETIDELILEL